MIAFFVGLFIGGVVGVAIMAILSVSGKDDRK